jgi:hypothetical protein
MNRRALIIYCDNTSSGSLTGPPFDNDNICYYLQSKLGGDWFDKEILSLPNPTSSIVAKAVNGFLKGADYTFVIFTGHGFINLDDNKRQYIELEDKDIWIGNLRTSAPRQTLIVDACRGYHSPFQELLKSFSDLFEDLIGDSTSTRQLFDNAVMRAEEGLSILYAASKNQTASDSDFGAAYLLSLLKVAELWSKTNTRSSVLNLKEVHEYAITYLRDNFETIQVPRMNSEKRNRYYPFAVKSISIHG